MPWLGLESDAAPDCSCTWLRVYLLSAQRSLQPTSALRLPRPRSSVILRELQEGAILFSTESEIYFSLNPVGLKVWRLLPPACSQVDEVVAKIHSDFPDVSVETIASDVQSLLSELRSQGLVEVQETH